MKLFIMELSSMPITSPGILVTVLIEENVELKLLKSLNTKIISE